MWKIASVLGWLAVAAGSSMFMLCLLMLFNRSPHDFEGMIIGAAIQIIVVVALPVFVIGLMLVAFGARKKAACDGA